VGAAPHPQSVISLPDGRRIELKIHQCVWSGEFVPNSLPAILDCYRAHVARAEIDIAMLRDEDFLVVHDLDLAECTDGQGAVGETSRADAARLRVVCRGMTSPEMAPLLSQVAASVAREPYPTLLELDLKDWKPWPWRRVEELARLVQPIKERVIFGGDTDTNLRRLQVVDPDLRVGYTLPDYEVWRPSGDDGLVQRLDALLDMVPAARELHVNLEDAVKLERDGVTDLAARVHARGMLLDAWTINAGTPRWQQRVRDAVRLGADVITTETAQMLVATLEPRGLGGNAAILSEERVAHD
jgi:glycerophosphoryl diester phosphodiesterase